MHRIKVWLRHYFGFTSRESKGFIMLMVVVLLALSAPTIYSSLLPKREITEASIEIIKADSILPTFQKAKIPTATLVLFQFDPNTATQSDLINLGIKEFIAKRIINYRAKGGKFKTKEDLAKIYGLSSDVYNKLSPYIIISSAQERQVKSTYQASDKNEPASVFKPSEINLADTAQLKRINGVGEVLAGRIIKYRNKLGGFISQEQLYEVYGLDSHVVLKIIKSFRFKPETVKKLKVNKQPFDSLYQHPYIGRKAAKILVNYRLHHGDFKSATDLENSRALDPDKLNKLVPYLEF